MYNYGSAYTDPLGYVTEICESEEVLNLRNTAGKFAFEALTVRKGGKIKVVRTIVNKIHSYRILVM